MARFIPFGYRKTEVGFNEINRVAGTSPMDMAIFQNCSIPTMRLAHDSLERSGFPFGEVIRISK